MIVFWVWMALFTLVALLFALVPLLRTVKWPWLFLIILLLPLLSFWLYHRLGAAQQLAHFYQLKREAPLVKAELKKIKSPQQIILQLRAHLRAYPHSEKGWYLLGRLYLDEQDYVKAVAALERANQLAPHMVGVQISLAQALFFKSGRMLLGRSRTLVQYVLKRQPRNIAALNLLALDAYNQKKYQLAVQYWVKILPQFSVGSPSYKALMKVIAKAEAHDHMA